MKHRFTYPVLLLAMLFFALPAAAQESNDEGQNGNGERQEESPDEGPSEPRMRPAPEEDFLEPYDLGSQHFTIDAGLYKPLFFQYLDAENDVSTIESAWDRLTLGGTGSLAWGSYLNERFSLGVELSGAFSFGVNGDVHSLIPITMRSEYLLRKGSFEFPLHINAGVVFNRYNESLYFGPIVIPGIGAYYNLNAEWGLGFSIDYWWVPEIYFGNDQEKPTSFGNMMDISFSARYHFS